MKATIEDLDLDEREKRKRKEEKDYPHGTPIVRGKIHSWQSTTRWTPTTEQIRILKDLYYNNGVRSPSAEQIQKISAKLRQYGKIEGKNVFYWFQNHKARERQKKRLTTHEIPMHHTRPASTHVWRSEDPTNIYTKLPTFNSPPPGAPSPSASSYGLHGNFNNYSYGSLAMEKSFRDCSISPGSNGGGSMAHNFMWAGHVHHDPYNHHHPSAYPFLDKKKCYDIENLDDELEQDEEHIDDHNQVHELETLPLFPMHEDNNNISVGSFCNMKQETADHTYYMTNWYQADTSMACSRASLELTLNSYASGRSPNDPGL